MSFAYIDESERSGIYGRRYILGATIPFSASERDSQREVMHNLLLPNKPKVHWYKAVNGHKQDIVNSVARLDLMHCVVTHDRRDGESSERARSKCLALLAFEFEQLGVDFAVFESRGPALDRKDRSLLHNLRRRYGGSVGFKASHVVGAREPLLWIADAVCGAIGDSWQGNSEFRTTLAHQLHVVATPGSVRN